MSVIGNPLLLGGDAGAPSFTTDRSVRLRSSASAYFNRTPAAAGNRKTWTWSAWVKRGQLNAASYNALFSSSTAGSNTDLSALRFGTDKLEFFAANGTNSAVTTAVFRDPSAWYHIVAVLNTTGVANGFSLYVNGVQQTLTYTSFTADLQPSVNNTVPHNLGAQLDSGSGRLFYFDGYLTEVNFIDGQALTPASFGEYDSVRNTQWKPKAYTGTYGTNGFYLKFADNSNNTAATIGKDSSGNSNNWTPTGISVTAGTTYDSMTDVPTLTSETASNFSTMSPIATFVAGNSFTLTEGNLTYTQATCTNSTHCGSTIPLAYGAGKFYYEVRQNSKTVVGGDATLPFDLFVKEYASAGSTYTNAYYYMQGSSGAVYDPAGTLLGTFGAIANGDLIMVALDLVSGKLYLGKNGTWFNSGNPAAGTGAVATNLVNYPIFIPAIGNAGGNMTNFQCSINFGQRPFSYQPTGFKAINTYNLPDPAVASSDDYHKIYSYTGNGGGLQVGEVQKPASLFNLDRSLRFRSSATATLTRTPASAGNRQKFTISFWVKRGTIGGADLFHGNTSNVNGFLGSFRSDHTLYLYDLGAGAGGFQIYSTQVFRDPLIWYHIVVAVDTTQATDTNRIKVYINGVQENLATWTVGAGASRYPSLNANFDWNNTSQHRIGYAANNGYLDGYVADFYNIDGQQLTPTDFGAYDGNYYWTPKAYTGTYGTNGFHLEFEDFSAATAAAIGKDTSGQGNNWTPTGINVTTPANTNSSWDSMVDVPTLTSADVANFSTLDPLTATVSSTIKDGNLQITGTATNTAMAVKGSVAISSGKWYWECIPNGTNSTGLIGIASSSIVPTTSIAAAWFTGQSYYFYFQNGNKGINGTTSSYGATFTTNDVIGIALDLDAGTLTFYKNGASQGVAVTGISGSFVPFTYDASAGSCSINWAFNFGQRPFKYSNYGTDRPAATFKPLNSFNVAEVTGDLESPDFVWIKSRSASGDHTLFNSVTGVGKYLRSNASGAEITDVNSLIQFNKNGFLLGNATVVNASATTFVASAWKAAATTVTNTAGTITTQVRASPTAGISVVTYTGTLAGSTIGHGLSAVPKMVIIKNQGTIGTQEWLVGHASIGWGSYLLLSSPNLRVVASNRWNNTDPTSTVITLGSIPNSNTEKYVAYCFAEINGFSKFGSYLSNNATDGPFVYTGFRPRWLMVKRAIAASGTGGWFMYDASRNTYNVMDQYMFAESTSGDATLAVFDFTSNGFKIRSNNVHVNTTAGDTYIYMAFAEHPMKYSLAR